MRFPPLLIYSVPSALFQDAEATLLRRDEIGESQTGRAGPDENRREGQKRSGIIALQVLREMAPAARFEGGQMEGVASRPRWRSKLSRLLLGRAVCLTLMFGC